MFFEPPSGCPAENGFQQDSLKKPFGFFRHQQSLYLIPL
jgi:hypothetical protein